MEESLMIFAPPFSVAHSGTQGWVVQIEGLPRLSQPMNPVMTNYLEKRNRHKKNRQNPHCCHNNHLDQHEADARQEDHNG
jgi:hypothetical protein